MERKADCTQSGSAFNLPNALSMMRLLGSFGLIYLALSDRVTAFLCLYVLLVLTDWIDGKLAILLHQRTEFGARLDSVADGMLYMALFVGFCSLKWEFVVRQAPWIVGVVISYVLTSLAGLLKFRRLPSYHTWAAKASNHLVFVAVICVFAGWVEWPFYVAMSAAVLTNLEATAITIALPHWRADVRSIFEVLLPLNHTS
jgi:CDP-diacylglycerol--glycerol-3-phosphate 3-phosphatidyltransferase